MYQKDFDFSNTMGPVRGFLVECIAVKHLTQHLVQLRQFRPF